MLYSFDTETFLIQPGLLAPPLVCGSVARTEPGSERLLDRAEAVSVFRQILEQGDEIGGANVVYDLGVLCAHDSSLIELVFEALEDGRVYSTDILEALHDNGRGCMFLDPITKAPFQRYSLAQLEQRYLNIDRSAEKKDGWRLHYRLLDGVPIEKWPAEAVQYSRRDARGTYDVLRHQLDKDRLNLACSKQEMRAAWALHLSAMWGVRTDPARVAVVVQEIREKHIESRKKFEQHGIIKLRPCKKVKGVLETPDVEWEGVKLKYAEDKARLRALVKVAYEGDPPMTAGGTSGNQNISTSRDTLVNSGDPLLEEYGEAGANEKLFTTYCDVLELGTRVPINPSINSIVSTQRVSYRNPNLQNLPRKGAIRECFVPRPGFLYAAVDYSALELCTLAQVCLWLFQKSEMAEAINAGRDLHVQMAAGVSGISYEEAIACVEAEDVEILNLRQSMKAANFGLPGLMGAPKLVLSARKDGLSFCELAGVSDDCSKNRRISEWYQRKIPPVCAECLELASRYKEAWYETWPEMRDYHKAAQAQADECSQGTPLQSLGEGEMLRLETVPGSCANHWFQRLAAVGAKHALWLLSKECYTNRNSVLYNNCRPVVSLHDEIITEVREEVAHEALLRQSEIMVAAMQEHVPDVKISVSAALCRRWFKKAKKALDSKGRYRPWWPTDWTWPADQEQMKADLAR